MWLLSSLFACSLWDDSFGVLARTFGDGLLKRWMVLKLVSFLASLFSELNAPCFRRAAMKLGNFRAITIQNLAELKRDKKSERCAHMHGESMHLGPR